MTRNARFWEFINGGLVKLTLRPDDDFSWSASHRTEEGWSHEYAEWRHDGDSVACITGSDGTDCDGRYSQGMEHMCPLADLAAGNEPYGVDDCEGIRFPRWQRVDAYQRDYAAEMAGY